MTEHLMLQLTGIIVLGISAQWLAWRIRFPAILLLLLTGLVAGPVSGWLKPDVLFGALFTPLVSLSVAIILFEGGLSLKVADLRQVGGVVRNLLSIGALATWLISAGAAWLILGFDKALAVLLGAILIVTGPTVIGPLLRHVRPAGQVGSILRWEGIVIDPIGAILAVLVFEAILAEELREAATSAVLVVLKTVVIGGGFGVVGAGIIMLLLRRYWVPDFLQNPVTLMLVLSSFTVSNALQEESGLLTVTVLGIILANQNSVPVKHIVEFKENLRVLLISVLFVLLAARLQPDDLANLGSRSFVFLAILILLVRPVAVVLATMRSGLTWQERLFLAWIAPRGIIAASVASIVALRLTEAGYPGAERLVPITFLVIIGTVTLYSLTAAPLARWLGLAQLRPQGMLIVGAHAWAQAIASALQTAGYRVLLVDTNRANIAAARLAGLPTCYGSILAPGTLEQMDLNGIGRLLALTSNDEVNALAALRCAELFGRAEVYQLPPQPAVTHQHETIPPYLLGRLLMQPGMTYAAMEDRFAAGAVVKTVKLTPEFDYDALRAHYGESATLLFIIDQNGNLTVVTTTPRLFPRPGQTVVVVVNGNKKRDDLNT